MSFEMLQIHTVLLIGMGLTVAFTAIGQRLDGMIAAQKIGIAQALQAIYNKGQAQATQLLSQLEKRTAGHPAVNLLRAIQLHWKWYLAQTDDIVHNELVLLHEKTASDANRLLDKSPDEAALLFIYFTAESMLSRTAYYEHQTLKSVGYAKNAYAYLQKGRAYRRHYPDFYLSSGLYDYYREEYPELHPIYKLSVWFMRSGDKQKGLDQLVLAIRQSLFSRMEATLYLTHILTDYENRASEALPYLEQLVNQYPNNPFFGARYAEVLLNPQRPAIAALLIDSLLENPQPIYQQIGLLLKARLRFSQSAMTKTDGLAKKLLQNPLKDDAYQACTYAVRARVAAQTGQPKQARLFYKKYWS